MLRTLSFCITSYDRDYHLLDRLWPSLLDQSVAPDEIIVVSSGMPADRLRQDTSCVIANQKVPVYQVHSTKRLPICDARNLGASVSSGEITQFFDGDDVLHRDHINVTRKAFSESPSLKVLVHCYIRSLMGVSPEMLTPHNFSLSNLKNIVWSSSTDHIAMEDSKFGTTADGPVAIVTELLDKIKYRRYCPGYQDREMLRHLINTEKANVKGYDFPLMNYFPANETGRAKLGSDKAFSV